MKKIGVIFCVIAIFILFIPTTTSVEITPETIDVSLVGGNITIKEIKIKNTESYSIICRLSTIIFPDDIGINVTYSESEFTIQPHSVYTLEMVINTSIMIEPNTYTIDTIIEFIDQVKTSTQDQGSSDNGDTSVFHYIDASYVPPDKKDVDDIPDDKEMPEETDDDNTTKIPDYDNKHDFGKIILSLITIILGFLLVLIIITLIFMKIKKRKK